jgi:hypothetical protein
MQVITDFHREEQCMTQEQRVELMRKYQAGQWRATTWEWSPYFNGPVPTEAAEMVRGRPANFGRDLVSA